MLDVESTDLGALLVSNMDVQGWMIARVGGEDEPPDSASHHSRLLVGTPCVVYQ